MFSSTMPTCSVITSKQRLQRISLVGVALAINRGQQIIEAVGVFHDVTSFRISVSGMAEVR